MKLTQGGFVPLRCRTTVVWRAATQVADPVPSGEEI